jgi:hypothetical protein
MMEQALPSAQSPRRLVRAGIDTASDVFHLSARPAEQNKANPGGQPAGIGQKASGNRADETWSRKTKPICRGEGRRHTGTEAQSRGANQTAMCAEQTQFGPARMDLLAGKCCSGQELRECSAIGGSMQNRPNSSGDAAWFERGLWPNSQLKMREKSR